ncbi:AsmA-like C-terminal domain-containing protein [Roseibium algae]|uniref:AsmA-like C-terminal domain-containing protein n=1 Tax=Roseibium algae TaxID=3123038 RepID=A0ABU8TK91_9HYPH
MDKELKAEASTKRKRSRRSIILTAVLGLLVLGVSALVYAVLSGPIHLPMFAKFMAEQASTGPAKLSIVDASIDFTHEDGVRVVVRDAHLRLDGDVPVEIILPRVEAPLNGSALLSGSINFQSLLLDRPKVILGVPKSDRELPEMSHLMEAIDRVADVVDAEFARRNLSHVNVENGEVEITGVFARSFVGIDASVTRSDGKRIDATARIAGRVGPWEIQMTRSPGGEGDVSDSSHEAQKRRLAVLIKDITIGELLSPETDLKVGKGLGLPLSVLFESRFESDGSFAFANLVGKMSNGWFQLGRTAVRFDDVALSLDWKRDVPGIQIAKSHAIRGNTQIYFGGDIQPPKEPGGDWALRLSSDRAQFGSSDIPISPIMVDGITVDARFAPSGRTLFFDKASLVAGPSKAFASGSLEIRGDGPYLAVALDARDFPIGLAKQVWPITLVPPARRWIIDRIKAGKIEHLEYMGSVRPPAFDYRDPDPGWSGNDMLLDMTYSGASVDPVGQVPRIVGLHGTVKMADETLFVHGIDGHSDTEDGGKVNVPEGMFTILNLRERDGKIGVVDVNLDGGAKDLADILNSDPFFILDKSDLVSEGVSGTAKMHFEAQFPLVKNLNMNDVEWKAEGTAKNFTSKALIKGYSIASADLHMTGDRTRLDIKGKGILDGISADIDLLLPLGGSKVQGRQGVVLDVSAKQLKERGIDLTDFLSGTMKMSFKDVDGIKAFDVDLTKTRLKLSALGWEKSPGVPARVTFQLNETDENRQVQNFELTSDGVDVAGNLALSLAGDLLNASFNKFQLRNGDDASLVINRSKNGRYKVAISGEEFDARGLIRQVGKTKTGDSSSDFSNGLAITANLSRVKGFNGVSIGGFAGIIQTDAMGVTAADVTGLLNGRAAFSFEIDDAPQGGGRIAVGAFDDSGALLKFLDLYQRMRGGKGTLRVDMADYTTWNGTFGVTDLSITEDPAIKKLSQRGGANSNRSQGAVVVSRGGAGNGGEASFETMDIAFTRLNETLTITRGALEGAVIGGTVSGEVDLDAQTMDLNGTFVPIYALNNFFAKIPLLGLALGGDTGEGLIGVTYRLSGPVANPELSVNPISAIAPGIFRKMFEFQ